MFTHLDYLKEEVDLEAQTIDGTRFYKVPSGKMYPSITSVTSFYNREIFINWRKKVGEEEANKITRESTFRGTKYHDVVEYYIKNGTIDGCEMLPSTKFLSRFSSPLSIEDFMISSTKVAIKPLTNKNSYNELVDKASLIARAEGLTAHAISAEKRKKD